MEHSAADSHHYLSHAVAFGLLIGAAMGLLFLENIGFGAAMGVAFGVPLGISLDALHNNDDDDSD
ncbi:MAG: hypothetical protein ACTHV8_09840 [Nesterenkonia sp.]